LYTY